MGPMKMPIPGSLPPLKSKIDYEALRQKRMAEVDKETHHINLPFGMVPPGVTPAPPRDPQVLAPGLKAWNVEIPGPARTLQARIYMPEKRDGPIGLYFHTHGGGWFGFSGLDGCDTENSGYALGFGSAVLQVDHRVSWKAKFPAQVEDSFATYKWILEHADELGVDPTRIGIGGGCTGANIATVVSLMARDAGIQKPAVQWLWTPVFDTRNNTQSYEEFANYALTQALAEEVTRLYLRSKEDTFDWRASPLLVDSVVGAFAGDHLGRRVGGTARRVPAICRPPPPCGRGRHLRRGPSAAARRHLRLQPHDRRADALLARDGPEDQRPDAALHRPGFLRPRGMPFGVFDHMEQLPPGPDAGMGESLGAPYEERRSGQAGLSLEGAS